MAWGIAQSVSIAAFFTVIEVFGLLLILWVARHSYVDIPAQLPEMFLPVGAAVWTGIFAGAFIAFYAYIGFEDIVNVAEEVKDPLRNLPRAISASLIVTTLLYMAVSVASLVAAGAQQRAGNDAPLAMVYAVSPGFPFALLPRRLLSW